MAEKQTVVHPFDPIFCADSEILILGSLPSVKSRENSFYYGHPRNRFWPLIAGIFDSPVPETNKEKTELILSNRLALWDVIASCTIEGSSDASIRDVKANDLSSLLEHSSIHTIVCNGQAAGKWYRKYLEPMTGISPVILPSTSPANASCSLEKLKEAWNTVLSQNRKTDD